MPMLNALLVTACGAALGIGILMAVVAVAVEFLALRRLRRMQREEQEATDRYMAWVRADQQRARGAIADLRHIADAYHVHLPPTSTQDADRPH